MQALESLRRPAVELSAVLLQACPRARPHHVTLLPPLHPHSALLQGLETLDERRRAAGARAPPLPQAAQLARRLLSLAESLVAAAGALPSYQPSVRPASAPTRRAADGPPLVMDP